MTPRLLRLLAVALLVTVAPPWIAAHAGAGGDEPDDEEIAAADDAPDPSDAIAALVAREPTVAQVRRMALRYAGLDRDLAGSWARRSRWSALLPRLGLLARRGRGWDEDVSHIGTGDEHRDTGLDTDLGLEARAVWELDRLVFDPAEIAAGRASVLLHGERVGLAAQVTALYYRRRKAQVAWLCNPPTSPAVAARRQLAIDELTAQLDVLTGGAFSAALERPRE